MSHKRYVEVVCTYIPHEVEAGINYDFTSTTLCPRLPLNDLIHRAYGHGACIISSKPAGNPVI